MAFLQQFLPFDNGTAANFKKWATGFGQMMLTAGWTAQSGHGELVATNVSGVWTWTTTPNAPTAATTLNKMIPNFRGAWSSGVTYTSSSTTANGSVADVVTDGGLTYIHITATSSSATAPGSDTTNWQPWQFEIWKSNDALSSTMPIYVKFVYTNVATSAPRLLFQIGTGVDTNGNLTNVMNVSATSPLSIGQYSPVSAANNQAIFEHDSCYNNANLSLCWARNGSSAGGFSTGGTGPLVIVIDRAKNSLGADVDSYVSVYILTCSASSNIDAGSAIFLKPSLGGVVMNSAGSPTSAPWIGAFAAPSSVANGPTSFGIFGGSPAMPLFPLLGAVMPPTLGCVQVRANDYQSGAILPVWMYGALHNFMTVGNDTTLSTYSINGFGGSGVGIYPAIRWE